MVIRLVLSENFRLLETCVETISRPLLIRDSIWDENEKSFGLKLISAAEEAIKTIKKREPPEAIMTK
jgi:hypothetical protein